MTTSDRLIQINYCPMYCCYSKHDFDDNSNANNNEESPDESERILLLDAQRIIKLLLMPPPHLFALVLSTLRGVARKLLIVLQEPF